MLFMVYDTLLKVMQKVILVGMMILLQMNINVEIKQ